MLVACRLAGLSALGAHYAAINGCEQCGAPPQCDIAARGARSAGRAASFYLARGGSHSGIQVAADRLACPLRHYERDAPPVLRGSAGMGCSVGQDHITLAPARLPVGLGAMVADKGLGAGLRHAGGRNLARESKVGNTRDTTCPQRHSAISTVSCGRRSTSSAGVRQWQSSQKTAWGAKVIAAPPPLVCHNMAAHIGPRRGREESSAPSSFPLESPSQRRPAYGRRSLHNDEAGALQVLHKPLGDDLRHDLVCVVDALAALESQRKGQRRREVGRVGGRERFGVGHVDRIEQTKNKSESREL